MEDDLEWKMSQDGRQPWMNNDSGWKINLDGGGHLDGRDNLKASTKPEGSWNFVLVYFRFNINSSYSLSRKC